VEERLRPQKGGERRRVDEHETGKIDDDISPAARENRRQSLFELRRRVEVELAVNGDHIALGRQLGSANSEIKYRHATEANRRPVSVLATSVWISSHRLELVPDSADSDDAPRVGGILLQLAPKVRDVDVARALVPDVSAVPEVLHDLAAGEHLLR
jgi:hypothetical protein